MYIYLMICIYIYICVCVCLIVYYRHIVSRNNYEGSIKHGINHHKSPGIWVILLKARMVSSYKWIEHDFDN